MQASPAPVGVGSRGGRAGLGVEPVTFHPKRRRIVELVESFPGITISQLCRELGCKWGTIQYHLYMVERARLVQRVGSGRSRHLFPQNVSTPDVNRAASLLQGRTRELVDAVLGEPGIGQQDLTRKIRISRKVLRSCIRNLDGQGLLDERREGRYRRYFPTATLRGLLEPFHPAPAAAPVPAPRVQASDSLAARIAAVSMPPVYAATPKP